MGQVMYTVPYMSERTQIYLTAEQRKRLDELAASQGKSLARVIREAVAAYIVEATANAESALDATFGVAPEARVPSRDEWQRG